MQQTKSHDFMGTESIGKLILKFSIPAIIGQIVNMLYSVVDRMYIGNIQGVGGFAISGVGITMPLTQIITAFGALVGIGAAASISLSLGQGNKERAKKVIANGFICIAAIGLLITVFGNVFAEQILTLFGARENTMPYALEYLRPLLIGTLFNLTAFGMNGCISSDGNPKIAMSTMIIGATINIILDPIFIFGMDMGIAGAAYATVISQFIAACWVLFYFFIGKKTKIKISIKNIVFDRKITLSLLAIGSAPFLMQVANSIVAVIANNSLRAYGGDLAIGAMTVITSICSIFIMPIFGLTHGSQPIMGYNYGAKNYARVRKTHFYIAGITTMILTIGYLCIMLIPEQLVALFNKNDAELALIAVHGMRRYLFMLPVIGVQLASTTFYQSVGKPKKAMLIGLTRQVIFLIPAFLIMPRFFGLDGIWFAGPICDLLSVILSICIISIDFKKMRELKDGE